MIPHVIQKTAQNVGIPQISNDTQYEAIKNYYAVAGPDYEVWSKEYNMHFGFMVEFPDIFSLKKMLRNMNDQVLRLLKISFGARVRVADLGCGVGSVARYAAHQYPSIIIDAITIVTDQVKKGRALAAKENLGDRINFVQENFEALSIPTGSYAHAYAIESACHAHGSDKILFIQELSRILEPGGTFCIADGFLKKKSRAPWLFRKIYKRISRFWALPGFAQLDDFVHALEKNGMTDITIREISMRIAPSVAYVPWTCLKFFAREIWRNKSLRMKKERWHNVYAPVLGMILGMYRKRFGYYLISGKKR